MNPYNTASQPPSQYIPQQSSTPTPGQGQPSSYPFVAPPTANGVPLITPPDLAMVARNGYIQQQQALAAMSAGAGGQFNGTPNRNPATGPGTPSVPPQYIGQMMGMTPQMQLAVQAQAQIQAQHIAQQQAQAQGLIQQQQQQQQQHQQTPERGTVKKKRGGGRPSAAQVLARQQASMQPPHSSEHYIKSALSLPQQQQQGTPTPALHHAQAQSPHPHAQAHGHGHGHGQGQHHPQQSVGGIVAGIPQPHVDPMEPWADGLDELDPREIAMGRFRSRHEVLGEIFGPESIKEIPSGAYDPWEGLGIDGETLEAKVTALEAENAELESTLNSKVEGFKTRLQDIDEGRGQGVVA
ncbi:hypothetical protein CI109_104636 [Kwoniella shandongensis]|uniref:Uncharacterized protein n=1 Tax=Kwoniella shandongensis TaxID=1734106 RepID=A0A5M6BY43_9TREE|nr:uncharacterized protein CI109_004802 [Kwoniella shandongensis]KAA5526802.1 hypothetical protein CI109_004802 [Kwoniella shandongensis]